MTFKNVVLDSSALLAFLMQETGHDKVKAVMKHSIMSSINLAECYYILRRSIARDVVKEVLTIVKTIVDLDKDLAEEAGELYFNTRDYGLSIADCICLSLANTKKLPVYTADKQWLKVQALINAEIICIR